MRDELKILKRQNPALNEKMCSMSRPYGISINIFLYILFILLKVKMMKRPKAITNIGKKRTKAKIHCSKVFF